MAKKKDEKKETKPKKITKTKDITTTEVQSVTEGKVVQPVTSMEDLIKPLEGQVAQITEIEVNAEENKPIAEETVEVVPVEQEVVKEEPITETPVVEEVAEVVEEAKTTETKKQDKQTVNRLMGYNWNGQVYDY